MPDEITTTDLSKFGYREREIAARLLTASCKDGFPEDFEDDAVQIMFNTYSGMVFLTNSEYQVCAMNGNTLESFYSCPYCGHEGFKEEMEHEAKDNDCTEYLKQIGVIETEDKASE